MHLAIPQQNVFNDGSQKPPASVLLTVDPGTTLTSCRCNRCVNLVSSSVPGMTPDEVSVSDSSGKVLLRRRFRRHRYHRGGPGPRPPPPTTSRPRARSPTSLDPLVGAGHYEVQVAGVT